MCGEFVLIIDTETSIGKIVDKTVVWKNEITMYDTVYREIFAPRFFILFNLRRSEIVCRCERAKITRAKLTLHTVVTYV